jgi:hypothetical protein
VVHVQAVARGRRERKRMALWRKKTKVAREILDTERTYVALLKTVLQEFIVPLRADALQSELQVTKQQIKAVFSELEVIGKYQNVFFEQLQQRFAHWNRYSRIGDLFVKMV